LAEYPPTFNGIESSKRLCLSPAVLHSKCNSDAISSFDSPAAGQCLYTFPDINEEQTFRFSGVSIVHSNGTDATVKVAVRIKAFYSEVLLDSSLCAECTFNRDVNTLYPASRVEINGPAQSVNDVLAAAHISPRKLENSMRMASLCLQGSRCTLPRASSIEVIDIVAARDGASFPEYDVYNSTSFPVAAERFFVRIVPSNNAPNFDSGNPMKNFVACDASCDGLRSLELDFGQYFTFEGSSSSTITISGLVVKDDDLFEGCSSVPTCTSRQISVSVKTVTGVVRLNTLSDLSLQASGLSTILSFVGTLDATNAAIRSLLYDVVTVTTDPASPNRLFNTQTLNGPTESVVVTVSDQGYSGQSGFANSTSIRVPITVVAVNQAPKAVGKNPPPSREGVTITIAGPTFSDVDIADVGFD
jgi:hypothetical protein